MSPPTEIIAFARELAQINAYEKISKIVCRWIAQQCSIENYHAVDELLGEMQAETDPLEVLILTLLPARHRKTRLEKFAELLEKTKQRIQTEKPAYQDLLAGV